LRHRNACESKGQRQSSQSLFYLVFHRVGQLVAKIP
jgi:hypothetical protein